MTAHLQPALSGTFSHRRTAGHVTEIPAQKPPNPTTLAPGSLIHLWAPGDTPWQDRPILARVERTTMDAIMARDLGSGARCKYEVGPAYPAQLRWTWELAAPPESPVLTYGAAAVIDRSAMSLDERKELLFGIPGSTVRISTRAGESYVGVPTLMVIDGDDDTVCWVRVEGPTDSRGPIAFMVRFADITAVILGGGQ